MQAAAECYEGVGTFGKRAAEHVQCGMGGGLEDAIYLSVEIID